MYLQPVLNLLNAGGPLLGGGLPTVFLWRPVDGQTLPSGTFTRASVAQEFDGTDLDQVGSGVIRENSAAVAGGAKGYLPEPAATNLIADSNEYDAASWNLVGTLGLTNNGVGPLGLVEYEFDAETASGNHYIFDGIGAQSGDHTFSIIATDDTGQFITASSTAASNAHICMDLVNGTISQTGPANSAVGRITSLGGGAYRGEVSTNTGSESYFATIGLSNTGTPGSSIPSFTGSNETILNAHAQEEATSFATSPIITSGGSGSREADVLDTDVVIASEFGALLDVTLPNVVGTGNTITLLGPDATAEDIIRVDDTGAVIMDDGGTPVTVGTATLGTRIKVSYGRDATGRSASLDGAPVATGGAPGSGHEGDTFQIGAANSVNQSRCIHHASTIYSVRPSDSQLESLSS